MTDEQINAAIAEAFLRTLGKWEEEG